jgi:hypothetical protein
MFASAADVSPARLAALIIGICLAACTSTSTENADPISADDPTPADAVTIVLMPVSGSDACCRVFTDNPGPEAVHVVCHLIVSDLEGRVVFAGLVPGPPPGHRRSSGFLAPPGHQDQGRFDLPVDLERVRYQAHCPAAAWHGGPPI